MMRGRTFRVFISSTFADMKEERNAFAQRVYPRLRGLCESRGYKFQAVDLRWGVREEAALDQQTVRICLDEIRRSQQISPKPNFLVLLGDRYGWRPLPPVIPAREMEGMRDLFTAEVSGRVAEWYRRDENAVPADYVLQSRMGEFESNATWDAIERKLRADLFQAAQGAGLSAEELRKYSASATELEIVNGALRIPDAASHVFAFVRSFVNMEELTAALPSEAAGRYIDMRPDGSVDTEAHAAQNRLKERLKEHLKDNLREGYQCTWPVSRASPELGGLCEMVYQRLSRAISSEMDNLDRHLGEPSWAEIRAHSEFGAERRSAFIGRKPTLERIARYIEKGPARPLIVHGPSGSGKSALMAMAAHSARLEYPEAVVIERYIGAVGAASISALLSGISGEISGKLDGDPATVPAVYEKLVQDFPARLALARDDKPLLIFIDAIDQLIYESEGGNLLWLPSDFSRHVRIIVSTTTLDKRKSFEILSERAGAFPGQLLALDPMDATEGGQALERWLGDDGRTLTTTQRSALLGKFAREGSPLYLKLAFAAARRWKSYDDEAKPETLPGDVRGLVSALYARLSHPSEHGPLMVSRALGLLAAARFGLSDDEMLDLLWSDAEIRKEFDSRKRHDIPDDHQALPPILWSRLYFDLEPYLSTREINGVRLLGYFHRQLREVAEEAYLPLTVEIHGETDALNQPMGTQKGRVHGDLADYFSHKWQRSDIHALLELIHQLGQAGRTDEAKRLLTDYGWISKKLQVTGVGLLLGDYEEITLDRQEPAGMVAGAIRLSAHVLARGKEQLPGQLLGRLGRGGLLTALVEAARAAVVPPALIPVWPQLTPPGGSLVRTLVGHTGPITGVKISADGKRGISCSKDHTLILWDLDSGTKILAYRGHEDEVTCVAQSEDGKLALSGSKDMTLKLWRVSSGEVVRTLREFTIPTTLAEAFAPAPMVTCLAMSADGKIAVSGFMDRSLKVWDLGSGKVLQSLLGHKGTVSSLAMSANGMTALSGSKEGTLIHWDLNSGKARWTHIAHSGSINSIAVSRDGKIGISASGSEAIRHWDLDSGREIQAIELESLNTVRSLAISEDGKIALAASDYLNISLLDLDSGKVLRSFKEQSYSTIGDIAMSRDGKTALSGAEDMQLKLWDISPGPRMFESRSQYVPLVTDVAISADGKTALSGSVGGLTGEGGNLKLWDLQSNRLIANLAGHSKMVTSVAISADAEFALSGSHDRTLKLWHLRSRKTIRSLTDRCGRIGSVALSDDCKRALSGASGTVSIWDLESGSLVRILVDHKGDITALAFGSDGITALSGSEDKTFKLWTLETGLVRKTFSGHTGGVTSVAYCIGGRMALSGSEDRTLKLWDLESGRTLRTYSGHTETVMSIAVLADGLTALSCSFDGTLKVWELASGRALATYTADFPFRSARVARNANTVAAGGGTGRIHVLELLLEQPIPVSQVARHGVSELTKANLLQNSNQIDKRDPGNAALSPEKKSTVPVSLKRIRITSDPPGAEVLLNFRKVGFTPVEIRLERPLNGLIVKLKGYSRFQCNLPLNHPEESLTIQLEKEG